MAGKQTITKIVNYDSGGGYGDTGGCSAGSVVKSRHHNNIKIGMLLITTLLVLFGASPVLASDNPNVNTDNNNKNIKTQSGLEESEYEIFKSLLHVLLSLFLLILLHP